MTDVLIAAWFLVGVAGVVFWWTREFDLTVGEFFLLAFGGMIGPLSWVFGWLIHGDGCWTRFVIMRRRGK